MNVQAVCLLEAKILKLQHISLWAFAQEALPLSVFLPLTGFYYT